jgi:hypothetical protein
MTMVLKAHFMSMEELSDGNQPCLAYISITIRMNEWFGILARPLLGTAEGQLTEMTTNDSLLSTFLL